MPTLDLTNEELQALAGMLDAGVRAIGLRSVKDAAAIVAKMEMAAEAVKPAPKAGSES